jgi:hypothetical protein
MLKTFIKYLFSFGNYFNWLSHYLHLLIKYQRGQQKDVLLINITLLPSRLATTTIQLND